MITFFLKGPTFLEKEPINRTLAHRGSRELAADRLEIRGVFCDRVPEKTSNPRAIIFTGLQHFDSSALVSSMFQPSHLLHLSAQSMSSRQFLSLYPNKTLFQTPHKVAHAMDNLVGVAEFIGSLLVNIDRTQWLSLSCSFSSHRFHNPPKYCRAD